MSESVRVGVVGYGYWGANLARNLMAAPSTTLVAIADADDRRQKVARDAFPGVSVYDSFEELLDDPGIDAVVLATPASLHGSMALKVLASGRHVLVEKPLALDVAEAEEVATEAESRGLIAMVGHTFLYSEPVKRLKRYIVEGELGEVQYIYSQRLSLGRIRRDCNALWNFAPHDVSIMLFLLEQRPVEVTARGFAFLDPKIDDVFFTSLEFESGVGANLHVSWIDPRKTRLMTVVGDRKMAVYDDVSVDQKIWLFDAGVARGDFTAPEVFSNLADFQWQTRVGDVIIPNLALVEPLLTEMDAFGRACKSGEAPLTSARHGVEVVRVLDAMIRSAEMRGSPVAIDWKEAHR